MIATTVSIYSINIASVDNSMISLNSYRGKKILLVNTASASPQAVQLAQLQELQNQLQDTVVVIAFPSNSFGNEPRSGSLLKAYMRDSLGLTFPVAERSEVTNASANMLFRWLGSKSYNGISNAATTTDFQKFLVDGNGSLIGIFDSSVKPTSQLMLRAIRM